MREKLIEFIEFMESDYEALTEEEIDELPRLHRSFLLSTPKDQIALYLNAAEYLEPKRQRSSIKDDETELPKDIY